MSVSLNMDLHWWLVSPNQTKWIRSGLHGSKDVMNLKINSKIDKVPAWIKDSSLWNRCDIRGMKFPEDCLKRIGHKRLPYDSKATFVVESLKTSKDVLTESQGCGREGKLKNAKHANVSPWAKMYFGIQSSLCKTKRTSTLIVLQGLTFEAKGYGYMKTNINHNIYSHICIYTYT